MRRIGVLLPHLAYGSNRDFLSAGRLGYGRLLRALAVVRGIGVDVKAG